MNSLLDSGVSLLGSADVRRGHVRLDQRCVQALLPLLLPPCPLEPPHIQRFWSRLARRGRLHRSGGVLTGGGHLTDTVDLKAFTLRTQCSFTLRAAALTAACSACTRSQRCQSLEVEHRKKFEHPFQSEPHATGAAEQRWKSKHATTCARAKPLHSEPLALAREVLLAAADERAPN